MYFRINAMLTNQPYSLTDQEHNINISYSANSCWHDNC